MRIASRLFVVFGLPIITFTSFANHVVAQSCEPHWLDRFHDGQIGESYGGVLAFAMYDDDDAGPNPPDLVAAGAFQHAGSLNYVGLIARWDGSKWNSLNNGLCCYGVWGLVVFDDDGDGPHRSELYATGGIISTYDFDAFGIVKWDGLHWSNVGDGIQAGDNGVREPIVFDEDGPGGHAPALFVTGSFNQAGRVSANNIARWNGVEWTTLGSGLEGFEDPIGLSLAEFDDDNAGPHAPALYVGGQFLMAGGAVVNNVARWDGTTWTSLGLGTNGSVSALTAFDDDGPGPHPPVLVAAGGFTLAGGSPANRIAKWDGATWTSIGSGFNDAVYDLMSYDPDGPGLEPPLLVACGVFTDAGGVPANRVATWDGANWAPLGSGMLGSAYRLGEFDFDGSGPLPPRLLISGSIGLPDGNPSRNLYYWTGGQWRGLGTAPNSQTRSLVTYDDDGPGPHPRELIMGGYRLTGAGGLLTRNIARWDGSNWSPMGSGLSPQLGEVNALAVFDHDGPGPQGESLIAGGSFDSGNLIGKNIASWYGSAWSGLGGGTIGRVYSLAVFDDDGPGNNAASLFAGGDISVAGVAPFNRIAKWNGISWSGLGTGIDGSVRALIVFDEDGAGVNPASLFVGGSFAHANGIDAKCIAKWDGVSWTPLGAGVSHTSYAATVHALAVFDDDGPGPNSAQLYVGGDFNTVGEMTAYGLARWDGRSWTTVGAVSGLVRAMRSFDSDGPGPRKEMFYVGGYFESIDGISASNVAVWDGISWSSMGYGTTNNPPILEASPRTVWGETYAFAEFDTDGEGPIPPSLFVGGDFKYAGGIRSPYISEWGIGAPIETPTITQQPASPSLCAGGTVSLRATAIGEGSLTYQWRKNGIDLQEGPDILGVHSDTLVFLHAMAADSGQYECAVMLSECGGIVSHSSSITVFASGSGDGNADGAIDGHDVAAMAAALATHGPVSTGICALDMTANGILDLNDMEPFVTRLLE